MLQPGFDAALGINHSSRILVGLDPSCSQQVISSAVPSVGNTLIGACACTCVCVCARDHMFALSPKRIS